MKKSIKSFNKSAAVLTALLMLFCFLQFFAPTAAAKTSTGDDMSVHDALGFDTSAPAGYNEDEGVTESPYGKEYTTIAEVSELLIQESLTSTALYGNGNTQGKSESDVLETSSSTSTTTYSGVDTKGYSVSVEGNFSTSNNGKKANVATLSITPKLYSSGHTNESHPDYPYWSYNSNVFGKIELHVGSYNSYGGRIFRYGSTDSWDDAIPIGNFEDADIDHGYLTDSSQYVDNGDFVEQFMPYNYLKMATGDFDADGIDEIAVYIAEYELDRSDDHNTKARVEIYDLQNHSNYSSGGNWKLAKSIPLKIYRNDGVMYSSPDVPNMVSLTAADANQDGIDDLVIAWGYVQGYVYDDPFDISLGSKAEVFLGDTYDASKGEYMLSDSMSINLDSGGAKLSRAAFATGDADGDGYDELVVGGTLMGESANSRYVAIYKWNGTGFSRTAEASLDVFETHEGTSERLWEHISDESNYYSVVFGPANIAVGKFLGIENAPAIYIDSLLVGYTDDGLEIFEMANAGHMNSSVATSNRYYYFEYGARAADIAGNGNDVLITGMYYYAQNKPYANNATINEVYGARGVVHKDYEHFNNVNILTYTNSPDIGDATQVYTVTRIKQWENVNKDDWVPMKFCLPDIDNDTTILRYTGEHYLTYADPEVLAVLASPPHFKDLEAVDDNQMMESTTSYAQTTGSGGGSTHTHGFSAGAYTSFEQEFSIFGVDLYSVEMETEINNSFTWDFQQVASIEYEISYGTQVGQDSIVLYALPVETYVYEALTPDGKGGYIAQNMTVNQPYEPSVEIIPLERYNEIYAMYPDILPEVDGTVLTHEIGDPDSYPSSEGSLPSRRSQTISYPGNSMRIGYGQAVTQQTITMTEESEKSFSWECEISLKAGWGAAGLMGGFTAGTTHGAGSVSITTSGSSYSAEMQALPSVAQDYGYSFNWKMTSFLYDGKYPVVTYLVTSVTQPPNLPENFGASEELSSGDTLALEWDYKGQASGFNIYRYYTTTAGSDYYLLDTVLLSEFDSVDEDGNMHFVYMDKNLSPGKEYRYKIQTVGTSQPNLSIPSEEIVVYTKPADTPVLSLTSGTLRAYPDNVAATTVIIENIAALEGVKIHYQWEKSVGGAWQAVPLLNDRTLAVQYGTEDDAGVYRCRVTAMMDTSTVTVYSPRVNVLFARRNAEVTDLSVDSVNNIISATVTGSGTYSQPGGSVVFMLSGAAGEVSYTASLENGTATLSNINPAEGVYAVSVFYSGNRVFKPVEYDPEVPIFYVGNSSAGSESYDYLSLKDEYVYGEPLNPIIYTVASDGTVIGERTASLEDDWHTDNYVRIYRRESIAGYYEVLGSYWVGSIRTFRFLGAYDNNIQSDYSIVFDRFESGYAGWVGEYELHFRLNGVISQYYFTVVPKEASVSGVGDGYAFSSSQLTSSFLGDLQNSLVFEGLEFNGNDEVSLKARDNSVVKNDTDYRDLVAIDKNGKEYRNLADLAPGTYTLTFSPTQYDVALTHEELYLADNYDIDWPSVSLIVTGPVYGVTISSSDDTYGRATVATPENATGATAGQTLIFRAEAYEGYMVDYWTVNGRKQSGSEGQPSFIYTVGNSAINVQAVFAEKNNTLTVNALPLDATTGGVPAGNRAITDDVYFTSGNSYSSGYEVTFTAVAADGWYFSRWEYIQKGRGTEYSSEQTFTVVMPDASVTLNAIFERETYSLTLSRNLAAYDAEGNRIEDISAIEGDSVITIRAAEGYRISSAPSWTVNGEAVEGGEEYPLILSRNTRVSANVEAGSFHIILTSSGEGGTATGVNSGYFTGGTAIQVSALPARGYEFVGWQDGEGNSLSAERTYSFTATKDMEIVPVFAKQVARTVSISALQGGSVSWEIEGVDKNAYSDAITLYPGESVTLTANPASGKIVSGWTTDGTFTPGTAKTRIYDYDNLPSAVSVAFKPVTFYKVEFASGITATADGESISSGDSIGSGSRVEFTVSGQTTPLVWFNGDKVLSYSVSYTAASLSTALNISVKQGYVVTFDAQNGSENTTQFVTQSQSVVKPADPQLLGHAFGGWFTNSSCTAGSEFDFASPVTANITLYAKWTHVHSYQEAWVYDASGHWHACLNPGCDDSKHEYEAHTPDRSAATETQPQVCTVCGYVMQAATGHTHSIVYVPGQKATCTQTGTIAHYLCTDCGKAFEDASGSVEITDTSTLIIRVTHNYADAWSKDGTGHWKVCTDCGYTTTVEAHIYTDEDDSTCNTCGFDRGHTTHTYPETWQSDDDGHFRQCTGCDSVQSEKHTYGQTTWVTEDGVKYDVATCTVCGYESKTEHVHAWDAGTVTKPATETEAGEMTHTCTLCGETKTEQIPATGGDSQTPVIPPEGGAGSNCGGGCGSIEDVSGGDIVTIVLGGMALFAVLNIVKCRLYRRR